jgi:hypothetical protein
MHFAACVLQYRDSSGKKAQGNIEMKKKKPSKSKEVA